MVVEDLKPALVPDDPDLHLARDVHPAFQQRVNMMSELRFRPEPVRRTDGDPLGLLPRLEGRRKERAKNGNADQRAQQPRERPERASEEAAPAITDGCCSRKARAHFFLLRSN